MNAYNIYIAALLASGLGALVIAVWALRMNVEKLSRFESLPRNKYLGVVLAFLCLLCVCASGAPYSLGMDAAMDVSFGGYFYCAGLFLS